MANQNPMIGPRAFTRDEENANVRFERRAEAFYQATGFMAPGKDVPPALWSGSEEARQEAWEKWSYANPSVSSSESIPFRPESVLLLHNALTVRRWHGSRVLNGDQATVGLHTIGMLLLLDALWPGATLNAWRAVLVHDLPEVLTGDIPYPARHKSAAIREGLAELEEKFCEEHSIGLSNESTLTELERWWVELVDKLELLCFVLQQTQLGNRTLDKKFQQVWRVVWEIVWIDAKYPALHVLNLLDHLATEWYALTGIQIGKTPSASEHQEEATHVP